MRIIVGFFLALTFLSPFLVFADALSPWQQEQHAWKEANIPCSGHEVRCSLYRGKGCLLYENNPFYYFWNSTGGATVGENTYCPNENLPPFYVVVSGASAMLLVAAIGAFTFLKIRKRT